MTKVNVHFHPAEGRALYRDKVLKGHPEQDQLVKEALQVFEGSEVYEITVADDEDRIPGPDYLPGRDPREQREKQKQWW